MAGQLLSPDWWAVHADELPPVPDPDLLQRVLRDVFKAPRLPFKFQAGPCHHVRNAAGAGAINLPALLLLLRMPVA